MLISSQFIQRVREQRKYEKVGIVGYVSSNKLSHITEEITKDIALEDRSESGCPHSISLIA